MFVSVERHSCSLDDSQHILLEGATSSRRADPECEQLEKRGRLWPAATVVGEKRTDGVGEILGNILRGVAARGTGRSQCNLKTSE